MPCLTQRLFIVIENSSGNNLKYLISFLLISTFCLFIWPFSLEAKVELYENSEGVENQRSLESLRDLDDQNWQIVVYPNEGSRDKIVLRIVGFTGSLRLDHPTKLHLEAGIKTWDLEDITLKNLELANDKRDAAAEFLLDPLLEDLKNNRPLRLSLEGAITELPVPPYLVNEWRSIKSDSLKNA